MKLHLKAFALTCGILWGAAIFLATAGLLALGGEGETISRLGIVYFGYSYSVLGAFVGLAWGFVDGVIGGALFAWLYNLLAR